MTIETDHEVASTAVADRKAVVVHPVFRDRAASRRSPESCLEEAVGLTAAIGLRVVDARCLTAARPHPALLLGGGAVDDVKALVDAEHPEVVIVDGALSPVQQRNLERRWMTKVIDRTGLILEIFGERARTREGQLQVELAHLSYQRSRLVRSWTHLERQRGGGSGAGGFLGGPGERQIELDRRLIDERIARLRKDLEAVRRTRSLHRQARDRVPYPVIALVGYTNAGKSTLFNRLTESQVFARDLLFATLDPTLRAIDLKRGEKRRAILSDTVGFISDLPTQLVAAFRATLEEVREADIILHVRDIAHPDTEAQRDDVLSVLAEMDIDGAADDRVVEAWNKIDNLTPDEQRDVVESAAHRSRCIPISALTGDGCDGLLGAIAETLDSARPIVTVELSLADGRALAWLHQHGTVVTRADNGTMTRLTVRLDTADVGRLTEHLGIQPVT